MSVQHLYLARHGQTILNAEDRIRGLADPPLDEVGIAEVERLADALAPLRPVAVHSSPLQRAVTTAAVIAAAAGVTSTADPRFLDRDYGPQTGRLKSEVEAEYGSLDAAPGVEPIGQVLARVRPALDDVLDRADGGPVVVVTHDAVIRPLIAALDPERAPIRLATASWNDLVRDGRAWAVLRVDLLPDDAPRR